ncbi:nucleoside triphosphate pyrophosphohydrolase [Frigoribacterium sp. CFBP 13605]|uniref:MazG nucleotide pyrophosphohydrolase domain-containing protein n=1 Tax=Frigoribacterium sp. CFBP 13605 TaxID=2774034 RepID=UPI0019042650|nr:MazG nucleotide pyrophosphohydrolase domain-containing protein [Frigoribacterium sp. CFBP 13605]MBD8139956.1 nucleoside triphosphate pyrophosphohydrolase [Frigoribacterium sp. CFBP 13605]
MSGRPDGAHDEEARGASEPGAGARLDELVRVVDALLADEGGCAWNRAQTPRSLVTYLVEETYELVEAIEDGTSDDVREELGDVLYQVVLHGALAARASSGSFDLADVVRDVAEKTVRRHPHVFGADRADDVDEIVRLWSAAKAGEKSQRTSAYDGVPVGQPALARAQKLDARRAAAGGVRPEPVRAPTTTSGTEVTGTEVTGTAATDARAESRELAWGRSLLAQVDEATDRGMDAERALRAAVREREMLLRRDEAEPAGGGQLEGGQAEGEEPEGAQAGGGTIEGGTIEGRPVEQVPPQPE